MLDLDLVFGFANKPLRVLDVGLVFLHLVDRDSDIGLVLIFGFANKPLRVLDLGLVFLHLVNRDSDIGFGFGFRVCEQTT